MAAIDDAFERKHIKDIKVLEKQVKAIYDAIIQRITIAADGTGWNGKDTFSIADYPRLKAIIDGEIREFDRKLAEMVVSSVERAFRDSNNKNDQHVRGAHPAEVLNRPDVFAAYMQRDISALAAFVKRTEQGLNLSARVFQIGVQFQAEIEQSLSLMIREGMSARAGAAMIKGFLLEPDRLFRRVYDSKGKLRLSKMAKQYKPGQGIYRSSYKNAMRVTRTETNMAYRRADFDRWQRLDFVTGIQVVISDSHPHLDECDELQGIYPKNFIFTGWHPQCLCYQIPVFATNEEKKYINQALLDGKEVDTSKIRYVTDIPPQADYYIKANADRIDGFKSTPYWVKDNFKGGSLNSGLDPIIKQSGKQSRQ